MNFQVIYEACISHSQTGGAANHFDAVSAALRSTSKVSATEPLVPDAGSPPSRPDTIVKQALATAKAIRRHKHASTAGEQVVVLTRLTTLNLVPQLARLMGVPVVLEVNGPLAAELYERFSKSNRLVRELAWTGGRLAESFQFRPSDGAWHVSAGLRDEYSKRFPNVEHFHIPNASNAPQLPPRSRDKEEPLRLFFGGALANWYDLGIVLRHLKDDDRFTLRIAGAGQNEERLRDLIDRYHIGDRVTMEGWCDHERLTQLAIEADVAIVPLSMKSARSDAIGSPLKLYDYLRMGLVVLGTRVDGIEEADGMGGLILYEDGSPTSLSNSLNTIHAGYARLERDARTRSDGQTSWSDRVDRFVAVLDLLAAEPTVVAAS